MSYQDLLRDPDFTRGIKTIAEQCSINVDIAKLKRQGECPQPVIVQRASADHVAAYRAATK